MSKFYLNIHPYINVILLFNDTELVNQTEAHLRPQMVSALHSSCSS